MQKLSMWDIVISKDIESNITIHTYTYVAFIKTIFERINNNGCLNLLIDYEWINC